MTEEPEGGDDGAEKPEGGDDGAEKPEGGDDGAGEPAAVAENAGIDEDDRLPLSELRERIEAEQGDSAGSGGVDDDAPLSELADESDPTTERERSELFEEVDVGDIDTEAVWEAVVEDGMPPEEALAGLEEAEAAAPESAEPAGVAEHVVDKREYCQQCEFFSEPPDTACSNEGTEILELVDKDHFRVRNCPKVEAAEDELSSVVEE